MLQLFLPSHSDCSVFDRCKKYLPQVVREARYFIGMDAPFHYFMGQIEVESRCNESITAFDGGMGLGQFMPETAEWIQERETALKEFGINPQPYDSRWAIRALILYDRYCYQNVLCQCWHYAFRAYNGGIERINKEIRKAKTCEIKAVEKVCSRRVITMEKGRKLDLCAINISYPYKIYQAGEKYRVVN